MFFFAKSFYSLRYGVLSPEELAAGAARRGIRKLVLTDINNTSGLFDFVKACRKEGVEAIAGLEFRSGARHLFTGIARNAEGLRQLHTLLSRHNIEGSPLTAEPEELSHCFLIYPPGQVPARCLAPNEFVAIRPSEATRLISHPLREHIPRGIIFQPVTFADPTELSLHRNLRAIGTNSLLSKLDPLETAAPDERFTTEEAVLQAFLPYPGLAENNRHIAENCHFSFNFDSVKNKKTYTASRYDDRLLLEKLVGDGMQYRYGKEAPRVAERVRHELDVIDKLGFSSYFLITWDIIRYSLSRGFYHVGRGSGANSIAAYCLKITDVDPVELDLYFERFINPRRSSPPDFDIDYSWKDRDEVHQYIFRRYGREHTALLGAMSTFKGKSILRELGKVYGLPKGDIDRLVEEPDNTRYHDDIIRHILSVGRRMANFPNLRSIHAGGVLISEEPITYYTALDLPPKGFPTTQWDMYVAEDIGFEKLDILSQRGIGHIREAADIIRENRGITVDVHQVRKFKEDPTSRRQLREGETNGCFYIESPAMRGLLKKLKCDDYLTLVAASSIIRPGVARSGMMKEYIHRFHHPGSFKYLHPIMEEQLKETYGVMVYQEDVLKVCHHFAGLDLADADVLRRAMSGKYRSRVEFQKIVDKFFSNCRESGYSEEVTREVWRQIESFAGYSFSKAHSASYAVESFQSLYLKAHYPLEFMVAVINNFGGFFPTWVYLNEAKRCGAVIELPSVNHSRYTTRISGTVIWLGFIHMKGLEDSLARRIGEERERQGDYRDLEDFVQRVQPAPEQLLLLIRASAFRFTGESRKALLWQAHMLMGKGRREAPPRPLFQSPGRQFVLPELELSPMENAYDEMEIFGFTVTMSPFDMLKLKWRGDVMARQMPEHAGREVRMLGHLVTIKYVRTVKGEIMNFGTFLDVEGNFFDSVHFPPSLKNNPFRGQGVYALKGRIVEEFGFPSLEVDRMEKMAVHGDPRYDGEPVPLKRDQLNGKHAGQWQGRDAAQDALQKAVG